MQNNHFLLNENFYPLKVYPAFKFPNETESAFIGSYPKSIKLKIKQNSFAI